MSHDTGHALAGLVEDALRAHGPAWLPGVAGPLAEQRRTSMRKRTGITPNAYGTARYLAGDAMAERDVAGRLAPAPVHGHAWPPVLVEDLGEGRAAPFVELGLRLAAPALAGAPGVHARLTGALECLARVPGLAGTLGPLLSMIMFSTRTDQTTT